MTRTRTWAAAVAVAIAAAVGGGWWWWTRPVAIDAGDARQVAEGRALYATHCAQCHGAGLEGEPDWRTRKPNGRLPAPPHDASGHTWHHPDETLFAITRNGLAGIAPPGYESDMPAFAGILSDSEIRAVLAYIKSTWPEELRRRQQALGGG